MRTLLAFLTLVVTGLFVNQRLSAVEDDSKPDGELANLAVGSLAPSFQGVNDCGEKWISTDYVGKQYFVVYFYPADFTSGCIKQAETLRDTMNQLAEQGIEVIGVSGDSVKNHSMFKRSWMLNYTLLADEEGEAACRFGVPAKEGGSVIPYGRDRKRLLDENDESFRLQRKATFARWTFIIGKDGKILYKNTKVQPAKDSQQVLEFIENLEKETAGRVN